MRGDVEIILGIVEQAGPRSGYPAGKAEARETTASIPRDDGGGDGRWSRQ